VNNVTLRVCQKALPTAGTNRITVLFQEFWSSTERWHCSGASSTVTSLLYIHCDWKILETTIKCKSGYFSQHYDKYRRQQCLQLKYFREDNSLWQRLRKRGSKCASRLLVGAIECLEREAPNREGEALWRNGALSVISVTPCKVVKRYSCQSCWQWY